MLMIDYIADLVDGNKIRSWRLKEWTNIELHLRRIDKRKPSTNFWWCIDKSSEYNLGDWMMFTGASDRINSFMQAIKGDHEWYLNLPEDQK